MRQETIFPPYFVAGAIFSGFAMVLSIAIPVRAIYHLEDFITIRHLENMGKIVLATGLIVGYGYLMEAFMAGYGGNRYEIYTQLNRMLGPYWWTYWVLIGCNVAAPQLMWFRGLRRNPYVLFLMSLVVNFGMWTERFVIVVTSLHRDYLPSSWGMYHGTIWDWATLAGSIGLFVCLFVLFIRFLPMISMSEMRHLVSELDEEAEAEKGSGPICAKHPEGRAGQLDLSPCPPEEGQR